MYLVPVENQSLAALEREIIIMKSIIYVSETANQPPQQKQQKNDFMSHDFREITTQSLG